MCFVGNKLTLGQVMACPLFGDKPSAETIMTTTERHFVNIAATRETTTSGAPFTNME